MDNLPNHQFEVRPWGQFERFTLNEPSTVKIIWVRAGEEFSLQKHAHRGEFWHFISGDGEVTIGTEVKPIEENMEVYIEPNTLHRVKAGKTDVAFLEIAIGEFDEKDIERLEDKYGRAPVETQ